MSVFANALDDAVRTESTWESPSATITVCETLESDETIEIDFSATLGHKVRLKSKNPEVY